MADSEEVKRRPAIANGKEASGTRSNRAWTAGAATFGGMVAFFSPESSAPKFEFRTFLALAEN